MLISAAPRAVHLRAADGSLALHSACLYSRPIDLPVMRYLLLIHPEAAIIPDGHGLLPKELVSDSLVDMMTKIDINEILDSTARMLPECSYGKNAQEVPHTATLPAAHNDEANSGIRNYSGDSPKTKKCVVCMERDASCLLVPCGHAGKSTKKSKLVFFTSQYEYSTNLRLHIHFS
jgi:hypothetical protein